MTYTPENNPYIPGDPYSYDLKWMVTEIKKMIAQYASLTEDFSNLYEYVHDALSNLDLTELVSEKIEEMYDDGRLQAIIDTLFAEFEEDLKKKADVNDAFFGKGYGEELDPDQQPYNYPDLIDFGELNEAPLAVRNDKDFDLLAWWYNDFGLAATAMAPGQALGAYYWYDWTWNDIHDPGFDPSRKPLFGFYPGDDPKVLDWICYWLNQIGITGVMFTEIVNPSVWNDITERSYWLYQLFNNVKNFKSLRYVLMVPQSTAAAVDNYVSVFTSMLQNYKNPYVVNYAGKRYVALSFWDYEMLRGITDGYLNPDHTILNSKLDAFSDAAIAEGYDGCIFFMRNLGAHTTALEWGISTGKTVIVSTVYSDLYGTFTNYHEYVDGVPFSNSAYAVNGISTGHESKNHPSNFNVGGSTPELFGQLVNKAYENAVVKGKPRILTIYNVSEWAEGGAGLIPNARDGFGYLRALAGANVGSKITNIDPIIRQITPKTDMITVIEDLTKTEANTGTIITITGFAIGDHGIAEVKTSTNSALIPVGTIVETYDGGTTWYAIRYTPNVSNGYYDTNHQFFITRRSKEVSITGGMINNVSGGMMAGTEYTVIASAPEALKAFREVTPMGTASIAAGSTEVKFTPSSNLSQFALFYLNLSYITV